MTRRYAVVTGGTLHRFARRRAAEAYAVRKAEEMPQTDFLLLDLRRFTILREWNRGFNLEVRDGWSALFRTT